ncbi:MAG: hypothetical protein ACO1PB_07755 [Ramlibacter sp.]
MSASQTPARLAIASQLMAALDAYERDTVSMVAAWPDLERYRCASEQVESIRNFSAALPEVRVAWVELLIAHAELVHFLWRMQYGDQPATRLELGPVRDRHGACVAALRTGCLALLAPQEDPEGQGRQAASPCRPVA